MIFRKLPQSHVSFHVLHMISYSLQNLFEDDLSIFFDLVVVNVLARVVMKNVANCDIQYELRSFGN